MLYVCCNLFFLGRVQGHVVEKSIPRIKERKMEYMMSYKAHVPWRILILFPNNIRKYDDNYYSIIIEPIGRLHNKEPLGRSRHGAALTQTRDACQSPPCGTTRPIRTAILCHHLDITCCCGALQPRRYDVMDQKNSTQALPSGKLTNNNTFIGFFRRVIWYYIQWWRWWRHFLVVSVRPATFCMVIMMTSRQGEWASNR